MAAPPIWGDGDLVFASPKALDVLDTPVIKLASSTEGLSDATGVTCAILIDGTLWCWGGNVLGQLGNGTFEDSDVPVQVPGLTDVVDLNVWFGHVCALVGNGTLWCWGANQTGQTGSGLTGDFQPSPLKVIAVPGVIAFSSRDFHGCAIGQGESVWCWGNDLDGQVGVGRVLQMVPPGPVAGLGGVALVDLSNGSAYAIDTEGTRWGWGADESGQLGDGQQWWVRAVPVKTIAPHPVVATGARQGQSYAALGDGAVDCWGCDGSPVGMPVEGIPPAEALCVGDKASCALDPAGNVTCWGTLDAAILGVPAEPLEWLPVAGLPPAAQVACGSEHSCVLTSGGAVWCWGHGELGQLGNGAAADSAAVPVTGVGGVLRLSARNNAACALTTSENVACWGDNQFGQLAQKGVATSSVPLQVSGLSEATAVGLGYRHTCAVLGPDGSVWCWGDNEFGQLGDGTTVDSDSPVQVLGVSGATGVWGGSDATCALMEDGTVWCWGNDEKGQLGREGPYKITPVPVIGFP